jgi:hypothetical protein
MQHNIDNHPLGRILRTLAAARRRIQMRRLLTALMATTSAALILWIALRFATVDESPRALRWIVGAWILASVAAVFAALEFAPDVHKLARVADRQFGLNERLSTAFELNERRADGTVAAALMQDTARCESRVQLAALAPLMPGDWRLRTLFVASVVLVLASLPQQARLLNPSVPPVSVAAAPEAYSAEHVETLAKRIEQDAAERQDPYLKAVAQTLRTIAAEGAQSATLPMTAQRIEAAIEHAANAYRDNAPKWLGSPSGNLRDQLRQFVTRGETPAVAEKATPQAASPQPQAATASSNQSASGSQSSQRSAATAPGAAESTLADAAETNFADGDYQLSSEDQARLNREKEIALQQRQSSPGAGQPVGGAQEAGKGGNMAGEGVQSAQTGEGQLLRRQTTDELSLQAGDSVAGRTVRLEVLPEIRERSTASETGGAYGAWIARKETPVSREVVTFDHLDLTRKYFTPSQGDARPQTAR